MDTPSREFPNVSFNAYPLFPFSLIPPLLCERELNSLELLTPINSIDEVARTSYTIRSETAPTQDAVSHSTMTFVIYV